MEKRRQGFTLIELLITVSVIAIMASMMLFALYGAGEAAKAAKTRALVTKATWSPTPVTRPSLSAGYLRRYNTASTNPNINLHEAAECLYLIVMSGIGEDADAREVFRAGDSADTDGDGLREFVDGWGKPIYWLRWPVGFKSELVQMPMGTVFDPLDNQHVYPIMLSAAVRTPDPLASGDVFSMQCLIYSAGPDGFYGVARDRSMPLHYADSTVRLNPYFDTSPDKINGTQWVDPATPAPPAAWSDNIHSHSLTGR